MNTVETGPSIPLLLLIVAVAAGVFFVARLGAVRGASIVTVMILAALAAITVTFLVFGGLVIIIAVVSGTYLIYYALLFTVFQAVGEARRARYILLYWLLLLIPPVAIAIGGERVLFLPAFWIELDMR